MNLDLNKLTIEGNKSNFSFILDFGKILDQLNFI